MLVNYETGVYFWGDMRVVSLRGLMRLPVIGAAIVCIPAALAADCGPGTTGTYPNCVIATPGTYAPGGGISIPAAPGTYIPTAGNTSPSSALPCFSGSFSYGGASACRAGSYSGPGTVTGLLGDTLANNGIFDPTKVGASDSTTLVLTDVASRFAYGVDLTNITLLNVAIQGGVVHSR